MRENSREKDIKEEKVGEQLASRNKSNNNSGEKRDCNGQNENGER